MEKAELAALLTAHGGRAQAVASLHILRGPSLDDDDHAFLVQHAAALATIDLSRWLGRAAPAERPAVIDALAALAENDPGRFEFEIVRAPHFGLEKGEQADLASRLRGRVPERLLAALAPAPAAPASPVTPASPPAAVLPSAVPTIPSASFFDPGDLLGEMDFDAESSRGKPAPAAPEGLSFDLFDDSDALIAPAKSESRTPLLDALLADLEGKSGRKALAVWKAKSLAAAKDVAEDWSPAVTALPPEMRDAAIARATLSARPEERAALLEWLLQNGGRKSTLVSLTLAAMAMGKGAENLRPWLAQSWIPKLLADRAGWIKYGARLILALMEQGAYSELDALFTAAVAGGPSALGPGLVSLPAAGNAGQALLAPLFIAFFDALAGLLRQSLAPDQLRTALACAAALACIGIPAQKAVLVRALRRRRAIKGDVAILLDLALKQTRGPKRIPRLEDFIAAVHTLSDAMT